MVALVDEVKPCLGPDTAAAISKELASDVRIPVSDARLNELKEQISSHTYKIDASAIASRMLLCKEAVE